MLLLAGCSAPNLCTFCADRPAIYTKHTQMGQFGGRSGRLERKGNAGIQRDGGERGGGGVEVTEYQRLARSTCSFFGAPQYAEWKLNVSAVVNLPTVCIPGVLAD